MVRRWLSFAVLLLVTAAAFGADDAPSLAEAESAIRSAVIKARGEASAKGLGLRALHGCFPLKDRPAGDVLCLVDMPGDHGELRTQEIPFRHAGGSWTLLNSDEVDLWPACPSKVEAQAAFRAIKKLDSLVVTDVPDDGELVDERGRFEKVKAPWRLMCVYSVKTKLAGEQTYVAYISREGGKYVFDPEIEVWLD
ncbi:MAG TPA: hypothetical protein VNM67_15855 [Thermoanaerobaculia bacterium]|jgi:hypothetical protein|nr:hypothetical protein [Thermoanaerobaculia bacterium]